MAITLDGTTGITTPGVTDTGNLSYTGTLTGGTGVVNIGSGQVYKDASGNVGLGVTPSAWGSGTKAFQLTGGSVWSYTSGYVDVIQNGYYNGTSNIYSSTAAASFYRQNAGAHTWFNAPSGTAGNAITFTQAMTLDASGNLLVGTTTSPTIGRFSADKAGGGNYWKFGPDSTTVFAVYNASNAGVYLPSGSTAWVANSDERLKTTLIPFENAAAKVCTLRAGTGRYLTDEDTVSRSFLIAQDVQKVLPEAVNAQADEMGTLGLAYADLIPLLTAAIQEQQALIESLTTRLTALENK